MQSPASPLRATHDEPFTFPALPIHKKSAANGASNKIDYSKFKTKMCRNFLMGLPCPFEERCAFSHGEIDAERMPKAQSNGFLAEQTDDYDGTSSSNGSLSSPKTRLTSGSLFKDPQHKLQHGSTDNFFSSNSSSESNSYASLNVTAMVQPGHNANATEFLPPPPPSYEAAVTTLAYAVADKEVMVMPPAYPTRYRHDPYSYAGIIFE